MKKKITKKGYCVIAAEALLVLLFFFLRLRVVHSAYPALLSLCDGFCISGLLYLLLGLVIGAISKGEFDRVSYMFHTVANLFAKEKNMQGKPRVEPYEDYKGSLVHKPHQDKLMMITGGASFFVSLILFLVYSLLTR